MTLRIGLLDLAGEPVIGPSFLEGLEDVVSLVEDELDRARARRTTTGTLSGLRKELARLRVALGLRPSTADAWKALLVQIRDRLAGIGVLFHELDEPPPDDGADAAPASLADVGYWLDRAAAAVGARLDNLAGRGPARAELIERAERLAALADDLVEETEFGFLFDAERQLFSIGFNVADGRLDASYYDTLASEARLASFVAIATGQISHEHWFKLGRSLTPSGASRALLSWSASMFEYLMPLLVMRSYPGTLLDETYRRRRPAADPVRRAARRAVGHFRVGVLRAGSRGELSVSRLRRARARPQAWPGRRPGHRAVREHARGVDGSRRRARRISNASATPGSPGATASTKRSTTRPIACRRIAPAASCFRPTWRTTRG